MYKDKDKQREANAERQRRYKAKHKGVTNQGVTGQGITEEVTPTAPGVTPSIAEVKTESLPKRGKDIKCFADLPPDVQATIERLSTDGADALKRTAAAIKYQHIFPERYYSTTGEVIGVAGMVTGKPGDADYNGVCTEAWRAERGR